MAYSIVYQAARISAVSKRSLARPVASLRLFSSEEPKFQLEKGHHQVAPLTDATLYAPQGYPTTESSAASNAATVSSETIFTPSVNAVFDD